MYYVYANIGQMINNANLQNYRILTLNYEK